MFSQPKQGNQRAFALTERSSRLAQLAHNRRTHTSLHLALCACLIVLSACSAPFFAPQSTATPQPPSPTPAPPTATPEPMAFTIEGDGVTAVEFTAQVQQYKIAQQSLGKTVSDEDASKAVLDDMTAQVLLARGARAAGFTLSDSALQTNLDTVQEQAGGADALAKWETQNGYATPEEFRVALARSLEAAWMRDKIVTAVPQTADQVHVQQILLYNEADANSVLEQLKAGGDFNDLAMQYNPATRGDLGWFPKGYLLEPNIEEAAFALAVGSYSDVIQTQVGFSIIKVLERDPNHPLSPDAYLALQQAALTSWVTQQRAAAKIILAPH